MEGGGKIAFRFAMSAGDSREVFGRVEGAPRQGGRVFPRIRGVGRRWPFALQPGGALHILRDEDCRIEAGRRVAGAFDRTKDHIRRKGADRAAGTRVLQADRRIAPGDPALLSAIGAETVPVRRRLAVCLLSAGDDLVAGPGWKPRDAA